ncbi:hypothetical protein [Leuconostoc mesenteroides]|nr:hypothetical protein [Leuconostoc mesenteroides]
MKHKKIIILVTLGALLCVGKVWADNNSWQGSPNLTRTRNIIDQLGQKLSTKSSEVNRLQEQASLTQSQLTDAQNNVQDYKNKANDLQNQLNSKTN